MKNLLVFSLSISLFACNTPKEDYLLAYSDNSSGEVLRGYKSQNGEIVIKAKYTIAPDTLSKMAIVLLVKDKKWEFLGIDQAENVLLKPYVFDNGPDYLQEGLFRFVENNKIGFANADGQKIIPAKYDFATPFENGKAEFYIGGHSVTDGEHSTWEGSTKKGFLNKNGQEFDTLERFVK
jgi:hypothetical protein